MMKILQAKTVAFINVPLYADILSVQIQRDSLIMWALVDTEFEWTDIMIHCFLTGQPIELPFGEFYHIGTIQYGVGVYHFYRANE